MDIEQDNFQQNIEENEVSPEPTFEKEKGKRAESSALIEFLNTFEKEPEVEKKLRLCIDFMRAALSQSGSPRFKDFWEGRKLCLPLFKENINPAIRSQIWSEYIELSSEARRLKDILDEQSVFAVEQIELAIQSIEKDLEHYDQLLKNVPPIQFSDHSKTIASKKENYSALQKELNLLNVLAARVNGLRKEIIKTEMRVRFRNKFFERLSKVGDRIFPQRKELIKKISDEFVSDVKWFIDTHFQEEEKEQSLFILREEIKALQGIAKLLTLNTYSFTETRLLLSSCWDKIKLWEKERKKEMAQKKAVYKENFDLVLERIKALFEYCKEENALQEEANKKSDEIYKYMQTLELGRDEVKTLKDELYKAKKPLIDKVKEIELERLRREEEGERLRKEKASQVRQQIETLLKQTDSMEYEKLVEMRDGLYQEYLGLPLNKIQKDQYERLFKQLRDAIVDRKGKAVMALSPDDLQTLEELKALLNQRKDLRQEIKSQLENYRKTLGGSGFDFEKAMALRELIDTEKERLDKANAAILEIEEKISELEG